MEMEILNASKVEKSFKNVTLPWEDHLAQLNRTPKTSLKNPYIKVPISLRSGTKEKPHLCKVAGRKEWRAFQRQLIDQSTG